MNSKELKTLLEEIAKDQGYPVQKVKKIEYKMYYGRVSVVVSFSLN